MNEGDFKIAEFRLPRKYIAGLWDTDIHMGLCWIALVNYSYENLEEYRAPTWSWASVDSEIRLLQAACTLASPEDPFGRVLRDGTYLRIRATVLEEQMKISRKALYWAAEYSTFHGRVILDSGIEEVVVKGDIHKHQNIATDGSDGSGSSCLMPVRTVRRLRMPSNIEVDKPESVNSSGGSDSGSKSKSERVVLRFGHRYRAWDDSNIGEQFTVWLLCIAYHGSS
ncbi:hypothetical protein BX600DRAFT_523518 [Xylariales sp. PMI_506]|nr:hypothetical protein BX600DRAFT_523518 [Xylariales sp. PMI_506]